jgi:hypothetical protein
VDLRTQYSYQMMDPYFVGLIFSVYNSDPVPMVETRDIIAFQAEADIEVRTFYTLSLNSNIFFEPSYKNVHTYKIDKFQTFSFLPQNILMLVFVCSK